MGFIYKITNTVNNKIYIGQTARTLNIRWKEHKIESVSSNRPLYKAMRKYGIDNFHIEILEEISNALLNERETYWIKKLQSYNRNIGYNCNIGGNGSTIYDHQLIIDLYNQYQNCHEVCRIVGCSLNTLYSILEANNIHILSCGEVTHKTYGKRVVQLDKKTNEYIATYDSLQDAARAVGRDNSGSASHISEVCKGKRHSAFGYNWRYDK